MANKCVNSGFDTIYQIDKFEIFQILESNYIENLYNDILRDLKVTPAYINLKEIALLHFISITSKESNSAIDKEILAKKRSQTAQIGFLSDAIGSLITKLVSGKLECLKTEINNIIREIIDQLQEEIAESIDKEHLNAKNLASKSVDINTISSLIPTKKRRCTDSDVSNSSPTKRLSQRIKKPNSKYFSKEVLSPVDSSFEEHFTDFSDEKENGKRKRRKVK